MNQYDIDSVVNLQPAGSFASTLQRILVSKDKVFFWMNHITWVSNSKGTVLKLRPQASQLSSQRFCGHNLHINIGLKNVLFVTQSSRVQGNGPCIIRWISIRCPAEPRSRISSRGRQINCFRGILAASGRRSLWSVRIWVAYQCMPGAAAVLRPRLGITNLNYEQRIGVHDWPLFFGKSKSSRIVMGISPNDFPFKALFKKDFIQGLNKMPLTQIFCLKPAYLHAYTIFQDVEAWTGKPHRKGQTGPGQDAAPGCSPYQGAMSVCKLAATLPSLPRGPTQSALSNAEAW